MLIYVNDILIMKLNKDFVETVKHSLNNKFNMMNLNKYIYYLETQITYNKT